VSKTSVNSGVVGVESKANGTLVATVDGDTVSLLNRKTSDGEILRLQKDSTTVGTIGSRAGVVSYIVLDPRSGGGGLTGGGAALYPTDNNGAVSNGALSLGDASARFNDLHLSGGVVLDEAYNTTVTATTTSTSQAAIASFAATTYGSAEVVVTAKDGTARHITKFLIVHTGSAASHTEYGTVQTGSSLATFDVDINGGNVRVLATPASTNSTVFNVVMTLIDA